MEAMSIERRSERDLIIAILEQNRTHLLHYHDKECGRVSEAEVIFKPQFDMVADGIMEIIRAERSICDDLLSENDQTIVGLTAEVSRLKEEALPENLDDAINLLNKRIANLQAALSKAIEVLKQIESPWCDKCSMIAHQAITSSETDKA